MEPSTVDPRVEASMERVFEGEPVPSLSETITARSVVVSLLLCSALCIVGMKLVLTSGFMPSLAIPAGLLGFCLPRVLIRLLDRFEVSHLPFTRQETTIIQTCVVSCTSIAFSGGFGSFILGMSKNYAEGGAGSDGVNVDEPHVWRLIVFLFLTSFAGLLAIMPFRNSIIIRHQLTFPSGAATAHLINTMHTPQGAKQASKQVSVLLKTFGGTVAWSIFQWFFEGGNECGFRTFPLFGLTAFSYGFYFDFVMVNVGVGMFCPYRITISLLAGALLSWGIIWPYMATKEGDWYPKDLGGDNISGINGYRVFLGISMILADGLLHMLSIMIRTLYAMYRRRHSQTAARVPFQCLNAVDRPPQSFDDRRRRQVFLRDRMPSLAPAVGYTVLSVISTIVIPHLYPQLKCHHVIAAYLAVPVFAFCNAYGNGITDVNLATTYGKIAMLVFSSWAGIMNGGVITGLAACGIIVSSVSTASDLMQDYRTGYLTLTSPHKISISQFAGTALGCVINPVIFWVFYKVHGGDQLDSNTFAPYAKVYRGIALLGESEYGLPRHTILLCKVFFAAAVAMSVLREVSEQRGWRIRLYIPSTIGMAVAFFVSPTMSIGMFVGSVVMYLWGRSDLDGMRLLSPAVACGLICGDGIGSLLSSMLWVFQSTPPICIKFFAREVNQQLDAFLATAAMS